ncbi:Uu.00g096410.m01.CDS01 [Anthostomella pinea]|uniref:Uu.00g096410.m01.CDS01 n=1 Tax=Anthostomella pinea TaxID=933095 RepID=A0AAI8YEY5_9PEZI|nr:Uu.00g096410.m01.CDS01 [Anthostomella pinea]
MPPIPPFLGPDESERMYLIVVTPGISEENKQMAYKMHEKMCLAKEQFKEAEEGSAEHKDLGLKYMEAEVRFNTYASMIIALAEPEVQPEKEEPKGYLAGDDGDGDDDSDDDDKKNDDEEDDQTEAMYAGGNNDSDADTISGHEA